MDSDGFLHDSSGSLRPLTLNYDGRVVSTMLVLALIILVIRLILKSSFL